MKNLGPDLRYALRTLGKSPVVTGAALLSLALGIGANTTIFTVINAILLRDLPVADPDRVVALLTTEEGQEMGTYMPVSRPNYLDLRDRTEVFSDLIDVFFAGASLAAGGGEPEQVTCQLVTSNYFTGLGVTAEVGRVFVDQGNDEVPGSEPVVVLSHPLWVNRFGADPGIVGQTVRLNNQPFTVLGVTPEGFHSTFVLGRPGIWVPVSTYQSLLTGDLAENFDDRRALVTSVYGRLRPGVSIEQAQAAVSTLALHLRKDYPVVNKNRSFAVLPLAEAALGAGQRDRFTRIGGLLMTVVGLVLLIACANVANLLLGRAASRRREIGIRLALGASRGRLVRQLLSESLVLALVAGGAGLLVAYWARSALWAMRPPFLQQLVLDLSFDPRVLGFTLLVTLLTGILFGLAPAIRCSRPAIVRELNQASDTATGAARILSFRNLLVIGQVALSLVALIGSGLFLRSLGAALEVDVGFEPDKLAMMGLNLAQAGYDEARGEDFYNRALERARSIPGVEAASLTTIVPLTNGGFWRTVIVEGRAEDAEGNRILVPVNTTDVDFFKTIGTGLKRGRDLSARDRAGAPAVAVINEAMAARFWPDEEPLGQRFHFIGQDVVREVVGIVGDTKYGTIGEGPQPQVYVPRQQSYAPAMALVVRAVGEPEAIMGTVRGAIRELDSNLPITNVRTGTAALQGGLWPARMGAGLLGILGGLALVLAAIGIYGVMAYSVSQRDREIAIRMAMGADEDAVLRLVMGQGMKVVAIGMVIGVVLGALGGRAIAGLLYGIPATDFATFGLTLAVLVVVAFGANLAPARRACGVDPVIGLDFER